MVYLYDIAIPHTDSLTIGTENESFEMCGYATYDSFIKTTFIRNNTNFERYSIINIVGSINS